MTSTVCASDPSLLRDSSGTDRSDSRHLKSGIQPLNQLQPHQHSTFRRLLPLVWYLSIWLLLLTRTDLCRMRQVRKVFVSVNPSSVLIGLAFLLLALPSLLIAAPATSSSHYDRCFTRTLSPSTVKIKYGSLRGLIVHLSSSPTFSSSSSASSVNPPHPRLAPMEAFLGVPYASPPTGALRFMPPVTPGHWNGIRRATRLAPLCPQRLSPADSLTHLANGTDWFRRMSHRATNQSEDCLYLNIYTPILDLDSIGKADKYREKGTITR